MGMKELAEGIILQSLEDLADPHLQGDCIHFFKGDDFTLCAELATMNAADQLKLLTMVKNTIAYQANSSRVVLPGCRNYGRKQRKFQLAYPSFP